MISFKEFIIREQSDEKNELSVHSLIVTYDVEPNAIYIQAPDDMQESDVQQLMDDMWLNKLVTNEDNLTNTFGKNAKQLTDARFEYSRFEHTNFVPKEFVKWDPKYNDSKSGELSYFKVSQLRYIIEFDEFFLVNTDNDDLKANLEDLFKALESNASNEYPIEIKFEELDFEE